MDEDRRNNWDRRDDSIDAEYHLVPTQDDPPKNEPEKQDVKKSKPFWKTLTGNIVVGVVSSLLTIGVVINLDGFNLNLEGSAESPNSHEVTKPINYTPTNFKDQSDYTVADVAEQTSPTIVGVVNYQQVSDMFGYASRDAAAGTGSGVIYKKEGDSAYIITNNHVIENANKVEVDLYNGDKVEAEVVGADVLTDLAVLKIDGKNVDKVATFGDSDALRPGDEVIAIGNPLGLEFSRTVTQGIVSAKDRSVAVSTSAGEWELDVIQTDAAINPGNSGGALINSVGEVIGINSLKISDTTVEGLGFAIPSNDVLPIADELIQSGEISRPYIGIKMVNVTDLASFYKQSMVGSLEDGIVVAEVEQGSPAQKAGLQANDIIVSLDGTEVSNISEFRKYLYKEVKPGDTIVVEYYRNGQKQTASVVTVGNK